MVQLDVFSRGITLISSFIRVGVKERLTNGRMNLGGMAVLTEKTCTRLNPLLHEPSEPPVMKPERITKGFASGSLSKALAKALLLVLSAPAFGALLAGCGTTLLPPNAQAKTPQQEALVCPECRMVAVTNPYRWGRSSRHQVYVDQCPSCQGAILTLLKEGKLQHKCSICKEKPFKCPLFHPTA